MIATNTYIHKYWVLKTQVFTSVRVQEHKMKCLKNTRTSVFLCSWHKKTRTSAFLCSWHMKTCVRDTRRQDQVSQDLSSLVTLVTQEHVLTSTSHKTCEVLWHTCDTRILLLVSQDFTRTDASCHIMSRHVTRTTGAPCHVMSQDFLYSDHWCANVTRLI